MKVWGVIPARYGSTRFEGKPLVTLKNKPLLQWVVELCQKSSVLDEVIVATDDQRIFDLCKKINVKVIMTSEKCASGTDRIFEALSHEKTTDSDIVINIQGDEPLLPVSYIESLVAALKESSVDMASLCHPLDLKDIENKNAVKVLLNIKNEAIYFSRYSIPFSRKELKDYQTEEIQSLRFPVQKHIGLYGYKMKFLKEFCQAPAAIIEQAESLEQLRALSLGAKIKMIPVEEPTYGVDTPEDLKRLEEKI